jgi:segregation and condensation protein B
MEELDNQAAGEIPAEAQDAPEPTATEPAPETAPPPEQPAVTADELLAGDAAPAVEESGESAQLKAVLEALVYVTEEPLTAAQIAGALQIAEAKVREILGQLQADYDRPDRGLHIKEVAGGYKMATKPEHHEAVRNFVKSLKPPLKLSLPALETLAVIAYKQPVTGPEIMEIRGVQGGGVLKTLLDRKLIAVAGRKNVIGKPMLYKTTREFLLQFGLKDLAELPSLKEFEEIRRMAFSDDAPGAVVEGAPAEATPGSPEEAAPVEATPEAGDAPAEAAVETAAPAEQAEVAEEEAAAVEATPEADEVPAEAVAEAAALAEQAEAAAEEVAPIETAPEADQAPAESAAEEAAEDAAVETAPEANEAPAEVAANAASPDGAESASTPAETPTQETGPTPAAVDPAEHETER